MPANNTKRIFKVSETRTFYVQAENAEDARKKFNYFSEVGRDSLDTLEIVDVTGERSVYELDPLNYDIVTEQVDKHYNPF